jgi:predicted ester cyclase
MLLEGEASCTLLQARVRLLHTRTHFSERRKRMSTEQNKKLVLRWKEELWDRANLNVIEELCAPEYVGHMVFTPAPVRGREPFKQLLAAYLAAFHVQDTREFLIAEGDMVVIHDTYRVKHIGEFQGIPPTGKEATVTGIDIYRIVDSKIVEQWFEADFTGLMKQLGVLPALSHAGS